MAVPHGKDTDWRLDNAAASLIDLSAYTDSVDFPQEVDEAETSVFGLSSKAFIVGLQSTSISIGGPFDPVVDLQLTAVVGQTASLSFQYGPQGTTGGQRQYTGECFLTRYNPNSGVGDAARWTAELRVTGDVTRGTY
jgi:hypothetical protein